MNYLKNTLIIPLIELVNTNEIIKIHQNMNVKTYNNWIDVTIK